MGHTLCDLVLGGGGRWTPGAHCLASLAYLVSSKPVRDLVST